MSLVRSRARRVASLSILASLVQIAIRAAALQVCLIGPPLTGPYADGLTFVVGTPLTSHT